MLATPTVLITGAAGNLGGKLRRHLEGRYQLRLIDRVGEDPALHQADLAVWGNWTDLFREVDVVVHLAADPTAQQSWPNLVGPNVDAVLNVFQASVRAGVKRVVYASSNHVMGGYKDLVGPWLLTTRLPPLPGAHYVVRGEQRDSTPYGSAKLFGERLGAHLAVTQGLSVIALRIGWVQVGDNRPQDIPADRGDWFRLMWLSNRDYLQLMEKCILADPGIRFAILNGMSANTGMRWDIVETQGLIGYQPQDDVSRPESP
jgi:nucleoside-diphosphate-sugar epimerase